MIQNFSTFTKHSLDFNKLIADHAQIQKIYSTSFYVCMAIRLLGHTKYLYLGRGAGHEGLWYSNDKPKPYLRKKNRFLEYLRKHLSSCRILEIEVPFSDRLLVIHYSKWGKNNKLIFFYKGRDLDILHHYYDQDQLKFFSNMNVAFKKDTIIENEDLELIFKDDLKNFQDQEIDQTQISDLLIEEEKLALRKSSGKKEKFLKRKVKNIEQDFLKVQKWKDLQEMANNFYVKPFPLVKKIMGIKFTFQESDSDGQKLNVIYNKIKNLQKAEGFLAKRLNETQKKLKDIDHNENNLKSTVVLPSISTKTQKVEIKKSYQIKEIKNLKIGYGQSSQGNDQLRKEWAQKNDIWFHLDSETSPHIILKGFSISDLSDEHYQIIGKLMADLVTDNRVEVDLVYTEVKNLKGVKGKPGAVTMKKQRYRRVRIL